MITALTNSAILSCCRGRYRRFLTKPINKTELLLRVRPPSRAASSARSRTSPCLYSPWKSSTQIRLKGRSVTRIAHPGQTQTTQQRAGDFGNLVLSRRATIDRSSSSLGVRNLIRFTYLKRTLSTHILILFAFMIVRFPPCLTPPSPGQRAVSLSVVPHPENQNEVSVTFKLSTFFYRLFSSHSNFEFWTR